MNKRSSCVSSLVGIVALIALAGCGQQQNSSTAGGNISQADRTRQLTALQEKRLNYEASLKAMSPDALLKPLAADAAKGRESFNSAAYREIVSRGTVAVPVLKSRLTRPDPSELLLLLALRQIDREAYHSLDPTLRISILIGALRNAKYFNAFGVPMEYWEDAAKAIIEEGPPVSEALTVLLADKRLAPVYGSEGAAVNKQYHYRVCDYAWALLSEIRHQKLTFPTDPAARDREIGS